MHEGKHGVHGEIYSLIFYYIISPDSKIFGHGVHEGKHGVHGEIYSLIFYSTISPDSKIFGHGVQGGKLEGHENLLLRVFATSSCTWCPKKFCYEILTHSNNISIRVIRVIRAIRGHTTDFFQVPQIHGGLNHFSVLPLIREICVICG